MDLDTTQIVAIVGSVSATIGGLLTAVVVLYGKWRSAIQEAAKGDIDVDLKATEASNKHRQEDADFEARESQRIIDYWKSLNAEISERSRIALSGIESKVRELEVEGEKRREEHIKCQLDNATMKSQIEHLREQVVAINEDRKQLRERVAALEAQV